MLAALFSVDYWLEHTTIAQRATLGGFDTASERPELRPAERTAIVGISTLETAKYFAGRRPIPPDSLLSVVSKLLRLKPGALVVDVFTDVPGYSDSLVDASGIHAQQERLIWAQAVDTLTSAALPILSGMANPPGRSGLASIISGEDRLVRTFRLRYASVGTGPASDTIESLPLAAAKVLIEQVGGDAITRRAPRDTASIALRPYLRDPPFYLLDDVLTALPALEAGSDTMFTKRAVVLGFIDGSDQVLTARGARAGPEVVADAIETVLDERGAIRKMPWYLEWLGKICLALLVGYIHYRFSRGLAAVSMVALTILVIYLGFISFEYFGFWTNFVLIVVGMWIEQLYEGAAAHSPERGPPAAATSPPPAPSATNG